MNFDYPTRAKAGITLIVVLLLATNLRQLKDTRPHELGIIGTDEISVYEIRFEEIRSFLPSHGVVNYTDDLRGFRQEFKAYYLTQYALAPLVLFHPAFEDSFYSPEMLVQKRSFVIANFHDATREPYLVRLLPGRFGNGNSKRSVTDQKVSMSPSFILRDFGTGVQLYREGLE